VDEKCCDEQYIGPNPLQHENPKPTTTELENGNKTIERINTNRVDKTINDFIQNPQGGMEDVQDVRNNPQRPKKTQT
jgi:chloramphenicol O-acetyltransferase